MALLNNSSKNAQIPTISFVTAAIYPIRITLIEIIANILKLIIETLLQDS